MGPPVHVALISPGEMETEEAFVKEVTKSREKKTTQFKTHTHFSNRVGLFFTVPNRPTNALLC